MPLGGILETVLYADDIAAARAFYADVLELEQIGYGADAHVFLRCGDQMLLIFNPAITRNQPVPGRLPIPPHGASGAGHVCFRIPGAEFEPWLARLNGLGIAIEADFEWPNRGRSVYFRDPAGNSVELAEPRIWGLT